MGLPRPTRGLAMTRCCPAIPMAGLHLLAVALCASLPQLSPKPKPYCHSEERLCLDAGISDAQLIQKNVNKSKFTYKRKTKKISKQKHATILSQKISE